MLAKKTTYKHVIIVGSTSDIGLAILKQLPYADNAEILLVGREVPEDFNVENARVTLSFHKCDLEKFEDLQSLASILSSLPDIDLAIMAAGFLPPENEELDLPLVNKSLLINTVGAVNALAVLAERMHHQIRGQILHISTVAAIRPRSRNFTYGASKSSADFFARGLSSKYENTGLKVSVLRPGFVYSKMTATLSPALFPRDCTRVAEQVIRGLNRKKRIIYAPLILNLVFFVLKLLPIRIFKLIDRNV